MLHSAATTLDDCRRRGRNVLEIGCVKCPRYSRHCLDELIAMCGPYYRLDQLAAFMSWGCPKRQAASIDDPCGARAVSMEPRQ